MNDRSIFTVCAGKRFRYDSVEYPVPKSSIEMRTPMVCICCSTCLARSGSAISTLSVSSTSNCVAAMPYKVSASARSSISVSLANCRADRFTATAGTAKPALRQSRIWRQAAWMTQRPIGTISPRSSASAMNSPGNTRPRFGWAQRSSASTLRMRPLAISILGW